MVHCFLTMPHTSLSHSRCYVSHRQQENEKGKKKQWKLTVFKLYYSLMPSCVLFWKYQNMNLYDVEWRVMGQLECLLHHFHSTSPIPMSTCEWQLWYPVETKGNKLEVVFQYWFYYSIVALHPFKILTSDPKWSWSAVSDDWSLLAASKGSISTVQA